MIQMNKKRLEKHIRNLRKNIQVIFRWTHGLLLLIKHLFSPVLGIDNSIDTLSVFFASIFIDFSIGHMAGIVHKGTLVWSIHPG